MQTSPCCIFNVFKQKDRNQSPNMENHSPNMENHSPNMEDTTSDGT